MDRLDHFLYGGTAGEQIPAFLGSLSYSLNPLIFLLLIQAILLLLGSLSTCYGRVLAPLLRILLYVTVFLFSLFILYPFFVMFITAFRSNAEATDMYFLHILPTKWVWSNLRDTLDRGVLRYLLNSLLIAGGATLIAMFCGIPAAYAMARMNFRGKKAYLGFVIMSQMFSPVVLLVGISRLMNTLHLNDSLIGLMLINAAFNQAFAIWLLRGTFVSISSEMEQAACIDGCSTLGALLQILLPIAAPGIVTTLIFVFINSWNEYTISTVLISTQTNRPITVGITQFSSFNMIEWQYLFASALLATIPVVILFMCIEKHLAAGLTAGGVKG
ncbi:MAG: carbohydrate ABC transporter permease [Clostridia bacterium]|nr:carbohydrate ABC transporter permease [Clostridia bacterium]